MLVCNAFMPALNACSLGICYVPHIQNIKVTVLTFKKVILKYAESEGPLNNVWVRVFKHWAVTEEEIFALSEDSSERAYGREEI